MHNPQMLKETGLLQAGFFMNTGQQIKVKTVHLNQQSRVTPDERERDHISWP